MQNNSCSSSNNGTRNTVTVVSSHFFSLNSDVTFRSADGVYFYLHRKNLETNTGAFPPPEIETRGEIVLLTEDSRVLELLFQFVYPMHHPSLAATPFETLLALAEAAEKYEVYSAMTVCNIRMQMALVDHAEVVAAYAVKHDYEGILKEAAPLLLYKPLSEIIAKMPVKTIVPWIRYYEEWNRVLQDAIAYPNKRYDLGCSKFGGSTRCKSKVVCLCMFRVACRMTSVQSLQNLDKVFVTTSTECCKSAVSEIKKWRQWVEVLIQGIPSFSTFCSSDSEAIW